jgi:soluble lytic murein transglycosylase
MIFPSLEIKNLETFARANSLDPVIIMSLMKQESAFNSEAISTSNAFGLMQIITPTARDLDSEIEAENLFDPDRNMSLGARYVKQLMKRFDGEIIYALAGYNAGPGNADKWRALAKEKDNLAPDEAIELIGFKETHDYVQNILRNYYWYKRRFNGEGAASLEKMLAEIKAEGN